MKIEVEHPAFKTERLAVETAGLFSSPQLLVNGSVVKKDKGQYSIPSDSGEEISIILKHNFFDPVPKIKIGNELIKLARSFSWFEYLWFIFLFFSLANIPPVGGLVGAIGAVVSARVFRSNCSTLKKFGLTALVFVGALVALVVVKVLLQLLTGHPVNLTFERDWLRQPLNLIVKQQ
jgi:hypothetical protein